MEKLQELMDDFISLLGEHGVCLQFHGISLRRMPESEGDVLYALDVPYGEQPV